MEARVNHLIQDRDGTKLEVDVGHDETALIELWQVLEDSNKKGRPNGNKAGPAPGGVTAFSAFPAQDEEAVLRTTD